MKKHLAILVILFALTGCAVQEDPFVVKAEDTSFTSGLSGVSDGMLNEALGLTYKAGSQDLSSDPVVLDEQVVRDNQVIDPEEIKPGMILVSHHRAGNYFIVVLSDVYVAEGDCMLDYLPVSRLIKDDRLFNFYEQGFCSDFGMIPYDQGLWNAHNYLESTNLSLTEESVELLLATYKPAP